jgi:hypothetical protein
MKNILIIAALLVSSVSFAQDILRITKNKTPKNELHYKANIQDCKFQATGVKGYWLLGEEDGHLEDLLRSELKMYAPRVSYQKEDQVDFTIGAMDRLGNQLPNKTIKVRLENCQPKAYLEINSVEILITDIYVQIKLISVDYMILKGTLPDGSAYSQKIDL